MTPEELDALEAIRLLKARYCRLLDTKDWDGFAALFTDDATLKADDGVSTLGRQSKPMLEWRGAAEIRRNIEQLGDASTVHQCHTPEITLALPAAARGIWAMEDIVERASHHYHGYGHYHETYVFQDGRWKIAALHLTRIRIEIRQGGFEPLGTLMDDGKAKVKTAAKTSPADGRASG